MHCDDDYVNKPEKYKCLGNTIDENIFNKHNDQEKKTLVKKIFLLAWNLFNSTAALITNIPLTSWGNEMKFTEKIEKELI
jgi:hypothetical protein